MFKLAAERKVTWPVTVGIPKDGGGATRATFKVEFELIDKDEVLSIHAAQGDLLERQVVGWDKATIQGKDGQPLEYSDEAKTELLQISYVRQGLFLALAELNEGRAAARKN